MRQGQQNRRGRGRGGSNNNRNKNQNPLSRSFESNGPDVKIRGTPAHVAEKYITLARDAQSAGDPVLAENYLQHAEHYNRIIMTYREQQGQQGGDGRQQHQQQNQPSTPAGEAADAKPEGNGPAVAGSGEQPGVGEAAGTSAPQPRGRQSRERGASTRPRRNRSAASRDREDTSESESASSAEAPRGRRRESENFGSEGEQPEFLRRPVRRGRRAAASREEDQPKVEATKVDDAAAE